MPYIEKFVDPELALEHKGVKIWHTYKNDDSENNGPHRYFFAFDIDFCEGRATETNWFDVRELPNWTEAEHPSYIYSSPDGIVPRGYERDNPVLQAAWQRWHDEEVEKKHVFACIREAIDKGILPLERPTE